MKPPCRFLSAVLTIASLNTDNRNVISSTALTILGSNKVIALGVHPGGYSFGDNTIGANQDFTLTVSTAK